MDSFKKTADTILNRVGASTPRVPGVVAMMTDRLGNLYEGVAGERVIGGPTMTFDSVFALHSTTKAITGTAVLQAVEEGKPGSRCAGEKLPSRPRQPSSNRELRRSRQTQITCAQAWHHDTHADVAYGRFWL